MKSYRQLATEKNVHINSIRNWIKKAGIKPAFLEPCTNGKRGGLLTILDEDMEKQLNEWLEKRVRWHK